MVECAFPGDPAAKCTCSTVVTSGGAGCRKIGQSRPLGDPGAGWVSPLRDTGLATGRVGASVCRWWPNARTVPAPVSRRCSGARLPGREMSRSPRADRAEREFHGAAMERIEIPQFRLGRRGSGPAARTRAVARPATVIANCTMISRVIRSSWGRTYLARSGRPWGRSPGREVHSSCKPSCTILFASMWSSRNGRSPPDRSRPPRKAGSPTRVPDVAGSYLRSARRSRIWPQRPDRRAKPVAP
jgi:hypothetical protein